MSSITVSIQPNSIIVTPLLPIVEFAASWEDDWSYDPELEFISASIQASSTSPSMAIIQRRYGSIKHPWENSFSNKSHAAGNGYWIRVSFIGDFGQSVVLVGFIQDDSSSLFGNSDLAAGIQQYQVMGGLKLLDKIIVSQSIWSATSSFGGADSVNYIGWIPSMNTRDSKNTIVGNRTALTNDETETYLYGGEDIWTHRQYIDYLIAGFMNQVDGPIWTIGGQTSALDDMKTSIKFSEAESISEMLRKLIPLAYGLDFRIVDTDLGFEINVFALTDISFSISDQTIPRNDNVVSFDRTDKLNIVDTTVVESKARKVDTVRIIGKRIVVCGTLYGDRGTLVPKWSSSLEGQYIAAIDINDPDSASGPDHVRAGDKFKLVYQAYGAPIDWDLDGGIWSVQSDFNGNLVMQNPVALDTDGNPIEDDSEAAGIVIPGIQNPVQFQNTVRETLSWIPLKEGYDYGIDPASSLGNLTGNEAETRPPLVWLRDANTDFVDVPKLVQADSECSMSIHVPKHDWGVLISASPNHLLADGIWTDDDEATSQSEPRYAYSQNIATIAIESDHRLQVGYSLPPEIANGDGSEMVIYDDQAEAWVMLPDTVVDVFGDAPIGSGGVMRVLRNDADRLRLSLAGAVTRYAMDRSRAVIRGKGLLAWQNLLGSIFTTIQAGDDVVPIGSPITSMDFNGVNMETVIKTGYA